MQSIYLLYDHTVSTNIILKNNGNSNCLTETSSNLDRQKGHSHTLMSSSRTCDRVTRSELRLLHQSHTHTYFCVYFVYFSDYFYIFAGHLSKCETSVCHQLQTESNTETQKHRWGHYNSYYDDDMMMTYAAATITTNVTNLCCSYLAPDWFHKLLWLLCVSCRNRIQHTHKHLKLTTQFHRMQCLRDYSYISHTVTSTKTVFKNKILP